jgi:D-lactate dehydrogenase
VRLLTLRSAGFNHVDLRATEEHGVTVTRVPAYSPYAVAEHAMALVLTLNRKLHRAHARVREGNFSLEGLLGSDLHGKTVGVIGTGRIGAVFCRIVHGFGCRILAHDPYPSDEVSALGAQYAPLDEVLGGVGHRRTASSAHTGDPSSHRRRVRSPHEGRSDVDQHQPRGLVDTVAVIDGLKSGKIGALGLDVYEEEADLFFEDLSDTVIQDDVFAVS